MLHDPSRYRLLVAEDDRAVLELIRVRLTLVGYQVSYARDGREALNGITSGLPNAVILDVNMPELDGFGVLRAMKAKPQMADIPVMMLTARNSPSDVETAMSLGASDFLTKPFDDRLLLMRVARLCRPRRSTGANTPPRLPAVFQPLL